MRGGRLDRPVHRGGVHRIESGHGVVGERGVFDGPRERTDLIEAGGERDQSVARDSSVRRLETDCVAKRAGLANRTAGVAAGADRCLERGHGCGRSAARAARNAREIVRIARDAERGVLAGAPHREFVHVGLADRHAAGVEKTLHGRRGVRRDPVLENLAAARRARSRQTHVVFDRQRNARQWQRLSPRDAGGDAKRVLARAVAEHRQVGADGVVARGNAPERRFGDFRRRELARADAAGNGRRAAFDRLLRHRRATPPR